MNPHFLVHLTYFTFALHSLYFAYTFSSSFFPWRWSNPKLVHVLALNENGKDVFVYPPSFAQGYSTSAALSAHGVRCVLSKLSQCCTALPNTQSWQGYLWHPIYNNVLQSLMVPQTLMKSIKAGPSQFHCPWSVGILCASVDLDMSGCLAWDMEEWHYTLMPTQTSAALIMTRSSFGMIFAPISETPPIWVDSSVWEMTLVAKTRGHGSVA